MRKNLKLWRGYGQHELLTREMGSFTRTAMLRHSCHSEGPRQSGGMDQQELWGIQQRQKESPAFPSEETIATMKAGDWLAGQQLCWKGPWGSGGHKQFMSQQHVLAAEKARSVLVCMNRSTARRWSSQTTALVQLHLGYWAPSTGKISVNWSKFRRGTSRCLGILKAGYVQLGEGLRVAQQQFSNALLYRMWAELWLFVSRLNTIFFFVLVCLCLTCPTFICHDACCFACILLNCTSTWLLCYSLKLYCCYCLVCSRFFTKFRIKFLPQTFIMRFINLQF